MSGSYPHVFSAINIGPVEVRNRFYLPPHGIHSLTAGGPHGSLVPSTDWAHYLGERAEAGVGLVFLTVTTNPSYRQATPIFEASIPSFRAVSDVVHGHGAKIFAQLHMREGGVSWEPLGAMAPLLAPSDHQNYRHRNVTNTSMTVSTIKSWVEAQGQCARNLRDAGFDGIELHVSHGMVMEWFLSPYFNKRDDAYGGSPEKRIALLIESLSEVRRNVSAEMAVGIRLNCDELLPGGLTQDDTRWILRTLVDEGLLEFVDLDIAVEPEQVPLMIAPQSLDPLHIVPFAKAVGEEVRGEIVRIGVGGRVTTIAQAETLIADGVFDMVGATRAQLAEPELIKNAMEGREDHNRTCIATNFCFAAGQGGRVGFGCVLNPASGRERRWGVKTFAPSSHRSRVVVVGGGPAGLEASRVAAKLGHDVVLLERRAEVGGQLNLWASLPGREIMYTTVDWYRRQLTELGVDVRTGVEATREAVLAENPDAVVVATGSTYVASGESGFSPTAIPGSDRPFVYTPEQILEGGARPTGRVVLLDEERMHTSFGIAEILAEAGASVEIVTRHLDLPGQVLTASFETSYVLRRLFDLGVTVTLGTYIKEIGEGRVTLLNIITDEEPVRDVDAVVLATMRRSTTTLPVELGGSVGQLFVIGDALGPRFLFEATYEGQRFARLIGEPGAPNNMSDALALFSPTPDDLFAKPAAALLRQ